MKGFLFLIIGCILPTEVIAAPSSPFTFSAYFRSSAGSNLKGGQQECFVNNGSQGNEFRLGNECGSYGELSFIGDLVDAANTEGLSARAVFTFAFVYKNATDFETPAVGSSDPSWVLRQSYLELANQDVPGKFWIGKRFYRWSDIQMDDFFPVNFSGPGAGWGYKTGNGIWDVAVIHNSESKEINGSTTPIVTEANNASKTTLHVRFDEFAIGEKNKASFWGTIGTTPAKKEVGTANTYKSGSGAFLAAKEVFTAETFGNEVGVAYGTGVLASMSSQGELVVDCSNSIDLKCTVNKSNRLRVWDALTFQRDKWSAQFAVVFDEYDKETSQNSKVRWTSVGVQPIYYFTDRLHLISVLGFSNIDDESAPFKTKTLTRFTVGPQLALSKGYFSRPVLRFLYSNTSWNGANRTNFAGTSAQDDKNAQSLLAQVEVWF